jgi:hypothetical protein
MVQAGTSWPPNAKAQVCPRVCVGFILDKVAWDRFVSDFFGFPLSVLSHRDSMLIHHLGYEQ